LFFSQNILNYLKEVVFFKITRILKQYLSEKTFILLTILKRKQLKVFTIKVKNLQKKNLTLKNL